MINAVKKEIAYNAADIVEQIIASANTREEIRLSVQFNDSMRRMSDVTDEIDSLLFKFGDNEFINHIAYLSEDDRLNINVPVWEGNTLISDSNILYIRKHCKVSSLKVRNPERMVSLVVVK